jgi:hypothetical protein
MVLIPFHGPWHDHMVKDNYQSRGDPSSGPLTEMPLSRIVAVELVCEFVIVSSDGYDFGISWAPL